MKKIANMLAALIIFALILASNPLPTFAEAPFTGWLDTYGPPEENIAGPIFTGPLVAEATYRITVDGTFSVYKLDSWNSVCAGSTLPLPKIKSLGTDNGAVGLDANYFFAYPKPSRPFCKDGKPDEEVPVRMTAFQISADGGASWSNLDPVEKTYKSDHVYHYELNGTAAPKGFGFRLVDYPLTDNYGQLQIKVELINHFPVVETGGPYYGKEGTEVEFDGSDSSDPDGDALTYAWDFGDGHTGVGAKPVHTYTDNADFKVFLTVTDIHGASVTKNTYAYIANVPPVVGKIGVDKTMIQIGTAINAWADFTDEGTNDTHTAVWDWGDGGSSPGIVTEVDGSGSVTGSHPYTASGIYRITLTVTDDDGDSDSSTYLQYILVYDPADFITGGGWIWSPEGACPDLCGDAVGKVNFGLVSKYNKNLTVPSGQTEFQFQEGSLNFHSSGYEWLVIAGDIAHYKGVGSINGSGEYGFILTAMDGQHKKGAGGDKIRMKIWDTVTGIIVYDTQMGDEDFVDPTTDIRGGSIVIHDR